MDEEQGLQSPIAGGIRGIRRSVSSGIFTGRAVPPPVAQPDPQTTSLLSQNSLTLSTVSGQLTNISQQVGSLNSSLAVIQNNLSISGTLERQREAAKQKREAILAEQGLREGKESELEKKIQVALLSPVTKVATFAQGILSRLTNFLLILAGGWLTDKILTFIRLGSEGNIDKLNEFKRKFLTDLGILAAIGVGLTVGITKIIGTIGTLAGLAVKFAFTNIVKKPFLAATAFVFRNLARFKDFILKGLKGLPKTAAKGNFFKNLAIGGGIGLSLLNPKNLFKGIKNFFKSPFGKKAVSESVETGAKTGVSKGFFQKLGGKVFVAFEAIGAFFNYRNRIGEDKDGDGVGGQTQTQAISGTTAGLVGTLTPFLVGMTLFPELGSSLIGGIGLALVGMFTGGAAENLSDKITGVEKPGTSDGQGDGSGDGSGVEGTQTVTQFEAVETSSSVFGNSSDGIQPINKKQALNVSEQISQPLDNSEVQYVALPQNENGLNPNAGNGGISSKSPSDQLPNIPSSDFSNNFIGLTESIYNVVV